MAHLILYALPVVAIAVLAMILEARWAARHPEMRGYDARDTVASLSMGVLKISAGAVAKLASLPLFAWLYTHRIADLGEAALVSSWLILLVAEDLCFYWFHRLHHGVRVLWATHVNHHSSQHFNLSTGFRQTVLTTLTSPVFWAPLALLGYPPWMILVAQTWSQIYQFGLHTEAIGRLGPLEWILNTPSHHRVHHGTNVPYLDRNHGGIFILWDRLFGTFEPERERVVFGLTNDIHTFHPAKILFHEVGAMVHDVRRAPTLRAKLGYVFAPPGWSHDGSSRTARELRKTRPTEHIGSPAG
ncbi:MAG: sterol desaturase family protein [Deltaproteobacteria bacterium]|nr:sterol desaturase family protein [Deltaproteobacteria bacterium]